MHSKIEEKFFVSERIASELVLLNFSIKNMILFNSSKCVNRQSQDFTCQ